MGSTPEQESKVIAGSPENLRNDWKTWSDWEQPLHSVELSEYSIGKYPVTNREYQVFVKEAGYKSPQGWEDGQYPSKKGDHPVVNVSWNDAQEYCKWLSGKTNKTYRLPTEAEWEKAARGTDGRNYPWGIDFDSKKCNMDETGIGDTSPVDQFSPQGDSPYGCADMAGNVWEWCADWFNENEYKNRKEGVKDPQGPDKGDSHVLRGGSFNRSRLSIRCARRYRRKPYYVSKNLGFRVVVFPHP